MSAPAATEQDYGVRRIWPLPLVTSTSGLRPVLVSKAPAVQAVPPAADIPPRILSPFPGFGAATCCQPLPVLRATTVSWLPLASSRWRAGDDMMAPPAGGYENQDVAIEARDLRQNDEPSRGEHCAP